VDALAGAPGVHSARYVRGSNADRVQALLSDLRDVPWEERTARFRCVIVVVTQEGKTYEVEGVCEGMIAYEPVGEGGFGYDPIFYVPDYESTLAQLSRDTKNRISHRARAVQAALPTLAQLLDEPEQVS
jgi:XTP/dITP diphosphohydrolase